MRMIAATTIALMIATQAVAAKTPLRDVAEIDDRLMAVAIADELRKTCDDIGARMIKAYSYLNALKSRARDLGYSDKEIDAYVTSKSEKKRMRIKAETYLKNLGVEPDNKSSFCAYGRKEISKGTLIGSLLRAK